MHTLGSQTLTQFSTKIEREKGRRWIFDLSYTPIKGTQSLIGILAHIMGREMRRGGTLSCL